MAHRVADGFLQDAAHLEDGGRAQLRVMAQALDLPVKIDARGLAARQEASAKGGKRRSKIAFSGIERIHDQVKIIKRRLQAVDEVLGAGRGRAGLDQQAEELGADAVMHIAHDAAAFSDECAFGFLGAEDLVLGLEFALLLVDASRQGFVVERGHLVDRDAVAGKTKGDEENDRHRAKLGECFGHGGVR